MATELPIIIPTYNDVNGDRSVIVYSYVFAQTAGGAGAGDTFIFAPVNVGQWADVSVHTIGVTGNTTTVALKGSNELSPDLAITNWASLYSASTLATMALGLGATPVLQQLFEVCHYVRPSLSGSPVAGTYTINVLVRRQNPMRT